MFNKAFFLAFYSSARLLGYLLSGRFSKTRRAQLHDGSGILA